MTGLGTVVRGLAVSPLLVVEAPMITPAELTVEMPPAIEVGVDVAIRGGIARGGQEVVARDVGLGVRQGHRRAKIDLDLGARGGRVGHMARADVRVIGSEQRGLLEERQDTGVARILVIRLDQGEREAAIDVVVVVHRQGDLLDIVDALGAAGRLAGRLHGRQQQGDQQGDDRDHHQQFDQGKAASAGELIGLLSH